MKSLVKRPVEERPTLCASQQPQQVDEMPLRANLVTQSQASNVLHFPRRDPVGEALRLVFDNVAQEDMPDMLAKLIDGIDIGIAAQEKPL